MDISPNPILSSTFKRNSRGHHIDGLWDSLTLRTINNGYMSYDSITHSEHRCVWLEISYQEAFGHNMPAIARPTTHQLHCNDPRIVHNYTNKYLKLASKTNFFSRVIKLDKTIQYPLTPHMCIEYEQLDELRCEITRHAKKNP
jgi:hypothetical protein